jgi:hypothetical protein
MSDCHYITAEQVAQLDELNQEYELPGLYDILFDIEKQIIKNPNINKRVIKCPQHKKIVTHTSNTDQEVLVSGHLAGYGAEINWCRLIKEKDWIAMVEKVIEHNPNYEFSNEMFGGRTSDAMFTAIDLIGSSNLCYCPDKIQAFKTLDMNLGEDPMEILSMIEEDEYDEDDEDDEDDPKFELDISQDVSQFHSKTWDSCTASFNAFLERYSHVSHAKKNPCLHFLYKES